MKEFEVIGVATRTVSRFSVSSGRCLRADGSFPAELPEFAKNRQAVVEMYRGILLTRMFDAKAVELQRTGRLGTFASSLGQEAVGVGVASAMLETDVLVPSFREQAAQLWRGVRIEELLLYWGGDERGSDFECCREDFPVSIPVASHFLHAAGVSLAFKLRDEPRCAVAIAGDGATSKGDFYEALNLAGAWDLPMVFVVTNNGWAISMPRESQSAADTLAQKGIACGVPGMQVDGNDVLGLRAVTAAAIERARNGGGPMLMEALTYRLSDHTTADDAGRYRDEDEVSKRWKDEPVRRLRGFLEQQFSWSESDERALLEELNERLSNEVEAYLSAEPQAPESMFSHLYETLPTDLDEQLKEVEGESHHAGEKAWR